MDYKESYEHEVEAHKRTKIKLRKKEHELHAITSSASYKLAKKIALSKHLLVSARNSAHKIGPKRMLMVARNKRYINRFYESAEFASNFPRSTVYKTAVVLHLYYTEMAGYFSEHIKRLDGVIDYDLYVSVPDFKAEDIPQILEKLPNAHIAIVPNCGRDVLPFIQIMKHLNKLGYDRVLKIHSKKSPHRTDGDEWRDQIIESLIPVSSDGIGRINHILSADTTAIIGPADQYVSLVVNFMASTHHSRKILPKIIGQKKAGELMAEPENYGFFGGTMFWARTDAIRDVLDNVNSHDFEPELGQEDSTLAHAMERLLCVIPEVNGKKIFEMSEIGPVEKSYASTNIPSWSEMAIDHL